MHNFNKLDIWHKSINFTLDVYKITKTFPNYELFGLVSQFRRASISIPANISEGCGKNSDPDLKRFCSISMGSANECQTYIILSKKLGYMTEEQADNLENKIIEIQKMLSKFILSLT